MKFNKFFSIAYVMNRLQRMHKIPDYSFVLQDKSGFYTALPFLVINNLEKYEGFNEDYWEPTFQDEIYAVDCHAVTFYKYLTTHNQEGTWQVISLLLATPNYLFDYLSDKFDSFESEKTNDYFKKKLYNVSYLDKDLNFDYVYANDDLNILSIYTHK